jgi:NTP pyrophosphatase (non-canonical NTP hydrolase)
LTIHLPVMPEDPEIAVSADILRDACYGASLRAGWHTNLKTGRPFTTEENNERFPVRLMLIVSELAEAMEGHRKDLMDDHLPHRKMAEVELADAVIRIFDLAGERGFDLGSAIAEKLAYNRDRADHKPDSRVAAGGKTY